MHGIFKAGSPLGGVNQVVSSGYESDIAATALGDNVSRDVSHHLPVIGNHIIETVDLCPDTDYRRGLRIG